MDVLRWSPDAARARRDGVPLVGLESSVLAQGLPVPANANAAKRMLAAVSATGAAPAITAIVEGCPTVGLTTGELERFLAPDGISKASTRDMPVVMQRRGNAATTVAAALAICEAAEIGVFATGGIGGVHRDAPYDESADLIELSRRPVITVCAGAKAILDLPATAERLETLGIPLIGFGTSELPGFFCAETGIPLPVVVDDVQAIVGIFRHQRALGHRAGLLVVQPPPAGAALTRDEVDEAVRTANAEARAAGVRGSSLTPFLLTVIDRLTNGRSLVANLALLEANARVAGQIAVALKAGNAS